MSSRRSFHGSDQLMGGSDSPVASISRMPCNNQQQTDATPTLMSWSTRTQRVQHIVNTQEYDHMWCQQKGTSPVVCVCCLVYGGGPSSRPFPLHGSGVKAFFSLSLASAIKENLLCVLGEFWLRWCSSSSRVCSRVPVTKDLCNSRVRTASRQAEEY